MIRGESEPPSSFHQPEGAGVGKAPATGCCNPGGNSAQLLKKIATVVRRRSLTSWIDFMKRGKYAALLFPKNNSPLRFGRSGEQSLTNLTKLLETVNDAELDDVLSQINAAMTDEALAEIIIPSEADATEIAVLILCAKPPVIGEHIL
jgi:hypothetical protein